MSRLPSPQERKLWNAVARTVTRSGTPPSSRTVQRAENTDVLRHEMHALMGSGSDIALPMAPIPNKTAKSVQAAAPAGSKPEQKKRNSALREDHPIEERVLRGLRRGKIALDGRVDLHGLTQDVARATLLNFLQTSRDQGKRHVLVITGKGNEGRGVLRQNVPIWLNMPPLSPFVNGFREAHAEHGGAGALYVRLHRSKTRLVKSAK